MADTDLARRKGLPEDLRVLVVRYPRETWQDHANLGQMARFWLQRHDMFREMGGMLEAGIADFREQRLAASQFANWFAPRLQFFLQQLNAHHQIEDHHYFPVFQQAEKRLAHGFDILDSDHHVIHEQLEENAAAANEMIRALNGDADALRRAGDAYAAANTRLIANLRRHLEDEEDLIVPLILDRGERGLGIG